MMRMAHKHFTLRLLARSGQERRPTPEVASAAPYCRTCGDSGMVDGLTCPDCDGYYPDSAFATGVKNAVIFTGFAIFFLGLAVTVLP